MSERLGAWVFTAAVVVCGLATLWAYAHVLRAAAEVLR